MNKSMNKTKMSIDDEAGTLSSIGVFGAPGIETYLAQWLLPEQSLFFDSFDVVAAKAEFNAFKKLLSGYSSQNAAGKSGKSNSQVKVVDLKQHYVDSLQSTGMSAKQLLTKLNDKLKHFQDAYQNNNVVECNIEQLLSEDIAQYGKDKAIALNNELSLKPKVPMANLYFARDPANVLFDTCVLGNMAYEIRQPEVAVAKQALIQAGYNPKKFLQVTDGVFEGGDAMIIGDAIYIGSGMRSTESAIKQISDHFKDKKVYMVKIPTTGDWKTDMQIMHLDSFFMNVGNKNVLGCEQIVGDCSIKDMKTGKTEGFLDHLKNNGYHLIDTPKEEQRHYASNLIVLEPGAVLVPSDFNTKTLQLLNDVGVKTICAGLKYLTNGAGATHCMGLQLEKYAA